MGDCCQAKSCQTEQLARRQRGVLQIVLAVNGVMFAVELSAGLWASSLSLTGDSLDMLGDAVVYAGSLFVVGAGASAKAKSAILKGSIMATTAVAVAARALWQVFHPAAPESALMAIFGTLALVANLYCLWLLTRHKEDDINMSSIWLCSRNDIVANTSVLAAAAVVALVSSPWPDLLVGMGLTVLFARSAFGVLRSATEQLKSPDGVPQS